MPFSGHFFVVMHCKTVTRKRLISQSFEVAGYSFSGSIPPKFEHKLRRHKQRVEKIATKIVLGKDENLL